LETRSSLRGPTKQFTATAILLLAEEGKLSLSDPMTKFLPDYPVQGHLVTIQHLLSHTSGIRNYVELSEWQKTTRNDVSGAIIEKVSGQSYAEFLRTRLFEPLGMKNSRYEDLARITPGRVAGEG
jgi:D-alanyl-D-alanine carboxypeptidase